MLPALLALWLFVFGIRLGGLAVAGLYMLCLALLLAAMIRKRIHFSGLLRWRFWLPGFLLLVGLVAWRLFQIQSLAFPAWVDSVHHTLVVVKILEYGGLPPDLAPGLPVPFFYHYGFHLIDALFAFWSGQPADQAVLWFGQVLNGLVAISVYRVAAAIGLEICEERPVQDNEGHTDSLQEPPAVLNWTAAFAALAALLAGFVFQMPAYYLTWGRFTLLTGLVVLGPAMAAALDVFNKPDKRDAWIRLVLLVAGLCLIHYFALLLEGLFILVLGLFSIASILFRKGIEREDAKKAFTRLVFFSFLGILLALPWIWRVWIYNQEAARVYLPEFLSQAEDAQQKAASYFKYLFYLIGPRRSHIMLGVAGVGLLLGFRRPQLRPLIVWALIVSLFSIAWGMYLGPFRPDHFAIVLFFPAAILAAEPLVGGAAALTRLSRPWIGLTVFGLAAGLLVTWGIKETRNILNPATIIATPADRQALDWVRDHTPLSARFYINSVRWQGQTYRGVDGGYWLLPYTGRGGLVPPAAYFWGDSQFVQQINQWADRSQKIKGCTPDFWNLVRAADLTHVYVSKGRGSLQPEMLAQCPRLRQVYQQEGVFIFEILSPR